MEIKTYFSIYWSGSLGHKLLAVSAVVDHSGRINGQDWLICMTQQGLMPYIALITQKSTRSTITWLKIGFQVRVDKTVCSFFIVSENILTFADEENQPPHPSFCYVSSSSEINAYRDYYWPIWEEQVLRRKIQEVIGSEVTLQDFMIASLPGYCS